MKESWAAFVCITGPFVIISVSCSCCLDPTCAPESTRVKRRFSNSAGGGSASYTYALPSEDP
ncbi:hypothetical protein BDW74DRAFT_147570 [Aspergillus multicolor]|uniref:uncharacterized protein n=1 Tax=Aspergillus multicolor TaxID=41759 RepID=UPI003CCDA72A